MPGMDGVEATRRIREKEKTTGEHVPIVALTAHSMKGDRARFMAAGMDDYLAKPLDAARLYEVVRKYAPASARPPEPAGEEDAKSPPVPRGHLIDMDDLMNRMGGDEALAREVLEMFLDEGAKALDRVEKAASDGDSGELEKAAHYFKGMSANISAAALRDACYRMERLGAEGAADESGDILSALRDAARGTIAAIRAHLEAQS
jgi:HPt (histidine-containing phosphotransfer) domain-containing protein